MTYINIFKYLALFSAIVFATACSDLPEDFDSDGGGPLPDVGIGDLGKCTCGVAFAYEDATASSVQLRGSFDSWGSGVAMSKSGSVWKATLYLKHGTRVEYKFFVNGSTWVTDPENPNTTGATGNSYIDVSCSGCSSTTPDRGVTDTGPPPDQFVPTDANPTRPFVWRDGVMYFVMVDRFHNGDTANDKPVKTNVSWAADWQGGDLAGVLKKIKSNYFKDLGVNVLWLSSPVQGPTGAYQGITHPSKNYTGYHGYWPTKLTEVDTRIGTMSLVKQVVAEAHKQGIKVVMDYVMNHVHDTSPTYTSNKSWFWPITQKGKQYVCGQNGVPWDETCWFTKYLPDFNFNNSSARSFSINNAIWWAQQTGVDGFRLDAVKHITMSWLTDMRSAAKARLSGLAQKFYMVGETYDGSVSTLSKYINPSTKLDGQFDFPMRAEMVAALFLGKKQNPSSVSSTSLFDYLNKRLNYFLGSAYPSGSLMGTFLGNHDLPRTIGYGQSSPVFSDVWNSGEKTAWTVNPAQPSDARPYEMMALGYALLLTIPGLPLIYYGDEVGLAGGGDPDNRRMMPWSGYNSHQTGLKAKLKKMIAFRHKHPATRNDRTLKERWVSDSVYAYELDYGTDHVTVVINRSDTQQTITPKLARSSYTDALTQKKVASGSITIPARTAMLLE